MYWPVPPFNDPVPPSTNRYCLLLTQYHHMKTITTPYWPSTTKYQPVPTYTVAWGLQTSAQFTPGLVHGSFCPKSWKWWIFFSARVFLSSYRHINTENLRLVFLLMICTVGSGRWLTKSFSSGYWVKMYTAPLWIITPSFLFFPSASLWIMTPHFFSFHRQFHYQLLYFIRSWVTLP